VDFFGLSFVEILVIIVVAILVFGQRLPQVAGEAAATLQRVKRSLSDLRRETGIDQEIYRAKREFEEAARQARAVNVPNAVRREVDAARAEIRGAIAGTPPEPAKFEPNPSDGPRETPPRVEPPKATGDAATPPRSSDPSAPGPG
jgi:Sec-independent protein translocase protein TatA